MLSDQVSLHCLAVTILGAGCALRKTYGLRKPLRGWRLVESKGFTEARYDGTPPIQVHLEQKSSQTTAFSAVQSWRPEPNKLAFYRGRIFGIVESPGADLRTLNRFVTAFEKTLPQ